MFDSHCHLAGHEFEADLPEVIARARAAGLQGALVILSSGDAAEAARADTVRQAWPDVRVAVGIHPHQAGNAARDLDAAIAALDRELERSGAVALGEIGLDYHYDFAPRATQHEVFARQLQLARRRGLPVVIHTREATDDTFDMLSREGEGLRVVFHCFTGDPDMARRVLDSGAWLSLAGIVSFPKAVELHEVARIVPLERLLVETDAPYLAPVPHRGRRNEPAYVRRVVEVIGALRGESPDRIAAETSATFGRVFLDGLQRRPAGD